jgi:hypothetical protein
MLRLLTGLAAALLLAGAACAGELDAEFAGKQATTASLTDQKASPSTNRLLPGEKDLQKPLASELDQESPAQAYRGWRGGWHGGYRWGGYRGYYGGYRWGGYYGYRPWGYYGWRRSWYWGLPYVNLVIGYPYYYPYPYYGYPY